MRSFQNPILVLALFALACGCAQSDHSTSAPAAAARSSGAKAPSKKVPKAATETPARAHRKVIVTGWLSLQVEDYAKTKQRLDQLLKSSGGFIEDAEEQHRSGKISSASLTLRVPSKGFGSVFDRLADVGHVQQKKIDAEDVTEQYVDLGARLRNQRKLEARFLALLERRSDSLKNVLQVEQELARVRGVIERYEAQHKSLSQRISLATIHLSVTIMTPYIPPREPTLLSDLSHRLARSWQSFASFVRQAVIAVVGMIPWLPLWALLFFVGRALWRRFRKHRGSRIENASAL